MFWVFVTLLWAAMLLSPFVLLYLFLPAGRDCPRCAAETVPVRSALLRHVPGAATPPAPSEGAAAPLSVMPVRRRHHDPSRKPGTPKAHAGLPQAPA